MMKSFLLYGPPASGKTTVAKKAANITNNIYISIGEITREEIARKTEKGKLLKKYLDDVIEYPVGLISGIVETKIDEFRNKNAKGFILDGFPKYSWEAVEFLKIMEKLSFRINKILLIDVSLGEVVKRSSERRICQSCLIQHNVSELDTPLCPNCKTELSVRDDDLLEIIKRRYGDYAGSIEGTLKILDKHCDKIIRINGERRLGDVLYSFIDELTGN